MSKSKIQVDNSMDVIDSRSVIEYFRDLNAHDHGTDEEREEYEMLRRLVEQGKTLEEWKYGVSLIRDSYFTEYAEECAYDAGAIDRNPQWPLDCIDWKQAARVFRMDFTSLDFGGVTYWAR